MRLLDRGFIPFTTTSVPIAAAVSIIIIRVGVSLRCTAIASILYWSDVWCHGVPMPCYLALVHAVTAASRWPSLVGHVPVSPSDPRTI